MYVDLRRPRIPLPKGWPATVKSAVLHAISLARHTMAYTCGWAADSPLARIRLAAENSQLRDALAKRDEQIRILLARIEHTPAPQRSHYAPEYRMAILELKAACGWLLKQTAEKFLVTPATIASWMKRLDEDGPDALVQLPVPVNRFPEFLGHVVKRLKTLCPTLGKVKIAENNSTAEASALGANARTSSRRVMEPLANMAALPWWNASS